MSYSQPTDFLRRMSIGQVTVDIMGNLTLKPTPKEQRWAKYLKIDPNSRVSAYVEDQKGQSLQKTRNEVFGFLLEHGVGILDFDSVGKYKEEALKAAVGKNAAVWVLGEIRRRFLLYCILPALVTAVVLIGAALGALDVWLSESPQLLGLLEGSTGILNGLDSRYGCADLILLASHEGGR